MSRIVFTGGPGTGKTTLIQQLKKLGHTVYEDAATKLILSGMNAPVHSKAASADFGQKVFKTRCNDFLNGHYNRPLFYDRGLPDILGYSHFLGKKPEPQLLEAIEKYRYDQVFVFSPWEKIYCRNSYRQENYSVAARIHDSILKAYQYSGYSWISMPESSVSDRVSFIQSQLIRQGKTE